MVDALMFAWFALYLTAPFWGSFLYGFRARDPRPALRMLPLVGVLVGLLMGLFFALSMPRDAGFALGLGLTLMFSLGVLMAMFGYLGLAARLLARERQFNLKTMMWVVAAFGMLFGLVRLLFA